MNYSLHDGRSGHKIYVSEETNNTRLSTGSEPVGEGEKH